MGMKAVVVAFSVTQRDNGEESTKSEIRSSALLPTSTLCMNNLSGGKT